MNKYFLLFLVAFALSFVALGWFFQDQSQTKPERILDTYGQKEVDTIINGKDTTIKVVHTVPSFQFTNQTGGISSQEDFKGKIYVSDFFFTSCKGICPQLTATMSRVYEEYKGNDAVFFLSHTVDPETDTPEILTDYANAHGASFPQWHFVTGDAVTLYKQARNGYLIDNREGVAQEAFVHSQWITLIDKKGRIRGYYDGTEADEDKRLIRDIKILLKEE